MKMAVFVLGGIVLITSGVLQVLVRPRAVKETPLHRIINAATVRAVVFVCVGLLAVLVGLGKVPFLQLAF